SYSQRPGTKAASLSNQVPRDIIKRRARELRALSERKATAFRQSQVGRSLRVLTLRPNENTSPNSTPALSSNYLRLRIREVLPPNVWRHLTVGDEGSDYSVFDAKAAHV